MLYLIPNEGHTFIRWLITGSVDGLNLNIVLVMNLRIFSAQMCIMNVSRLFIGATQLVNIPRYRDGLVRSTFSHLYVMFHAANTGF